MRWRRGLFIIVLLGLIIAAIGYGFISSPIRVEVVSVSRGQLQVTIEAEGKTRVKNRYVISAPVCRYCSTY